jgi:hypothetical protein
LITDHHEVSNTLIKGKQTLGCFYATAILDTGAIIGLPNTGYGYGIIKLVTSPSISVWDYFWY